MPTALIDVPMGTGLTAMDLASGSQHACVKRSNGSVMCWGSASAGQIGYGQGNTVHIGDGAGELPTAGVYAATSGYTVADVVAGGDHSCVVYSGGQGVRCWGSNTYGELGCGHDVFIGDDESPTAIEGCIAPIGAVQPTSAYIGGSHTCAILSNGNMRCWGNNL